LYLLPTLAPSLVTRGPENTMGKKDITRANSGDRVTLKVDDL
jgi:hypothetical protein